MKLPFQTLAVGTASKLKLRAVRRALCTFFESDFVHCIAVYGFKVESGVPNQPLGADQILQGAKNRTVRARKTWKMREDAGEDASVAALGIESGLVSILGEFFDISLAALVTPNGCWGFGIGAGIHVPAALTQEALIPGSELGKVIRRRAHGGEKDPHRFLTGGAVRRENFIEEAVYLALHAALGPRYRAF